MDKNFNCLSHYTLTVGVRAKAVAVAVAVAVVVSKDVRSLKYVLDITVQSTKKGIFYFENFSAQLNAFPIKNVFSVQG